MNITLNRQPGMRGWTLGHLIIGGVRQCYTCEDVIRPGGPKIAGATAIPAGRYRVEITWSNRFGRLLPLLWNLERRGAKLVSGDGMEFDGIRIHAGNTAADTEGCILPGVTFSPTGVQSSRVAFDALYERIREALETGEVWMDVVDGLAAR